MSLVVSLATVFVLALACGWLLGPSLQQRLDEIDANHPWRGLPLRLLAAFGAGLPFALAVEGAGAWAGWLLAAAGWLPGLLRKTGASAAPLDREARIEALDRLLPQTQCGQCGFAGCRPYATAMVDGLADINQCPPGGEDGIHALATALGRRPKPLDPTHGSQKSPAVARIVEDDCIGCTKCIQACPVDAIIGAPMRMHTVIADLCTGCELCVAPCPVDCIDMLAVPGGIHTRVP